MAEISKQALKVQNNTEFPNNNAGAITPTNLRTFNVNMIDSLVDEESYNVDSGSWNQQIDALEQFTASASGLTTGSLLVTASAAGNTITFTKGDATTFNVVVATGSIPDITALNQATASLQAYTSSANIRFANLESTTASLNVSVSNINTFTQSVGISITNLNESSASQQTSINNLNGATGSYATTGSNTFTSANTFTSISASSFISASEFVGNGSKITGITASIALPILDEGIPQGNAFSMNFTGSGISAVVVGGTALVSVNIPDAGVLNALTASFNSYTASTDLDLAAIHQATSSLESNSASVNISISALNTFTASQSTASLVTSIDNLNTFSASALVSISNINSTTQSLNTSITNVNSATASLFTSVNNINSTTASLNTSASLALTTASFDNGTRNLTFTKGDNQTFSVNIPDVSGSTGNFATTGSNVFTGNQTISGSLFISGSEVVAGEVTASRLRVNSATSLGGTLSVAFDTIMRGDLTVESTSPQIKLRDNGAGGFSSGYDVRVDTGSFEIYDDTHNRNVLSDFFDSASASHTTSLTSEIIVISGSQSVTVIGALTASLQNGHVFVGNAGGVTSQVPTSSIQSDVSGLVTTSSFNAYTASTNVRLDNIQATTQSLNTSVSALNTFSASTLVSLTNINSTTASQQISIDNLNTNSGSVNISIGALNTFTASQSTASIVDSITQLNTFTQSAAVSITNLNSATASLFTSASLTLTTASVNLNTITFTKGDGTTFPLTVDTGSGGGGGAAFPFVGDAQISGSLGVTGSFNTLPITLSVAASTASIDMRAGNTFILNIPTATTTHIIPTNIIAGQTINLLVKQAAGATTGSLSYSPIILFPSGLDMIPTSTGSAVDLISMISFDTTNLMAANVKNLR